MNIRKNQGITIITLVITIIVLLIISTITITGNMQNHKNVEEQSQINELKIIQHAILERNVKSQLTKEKLPGKEIDIEEVEKIVEEINKKIEQTHESINLKAIGEYKRLNKTDLENLGIEKEDNVFIVNYQTGEVINETIKVTKSGKALYTF